MQNDVTTSWAKFDHGKVATLTAAQQLTSTSTKCHQGVWVKAAAGNGGIVYVGNSDVTNGSVNATDGYELSAGNSILVPVSNVNSVYVIGSDVGQKVFWLSV